MTFAAGRVVEQVVWEQPVEAAYTPIRHSRSMGPHRRYWLKVSSSPLPHGRLNTVLGLNDGRALRPFSALIIIIRNV